MPFDAYVHGITNARNIGQAAKQEDFMNCGSEQAHSMIKGNFAASMVHMENSKIEEEERGDTELNIRLDKKMASISSV